MYICQHVSEVGSKHQLPTCQRLQNSTRDRPVAFWEVNTPPHTHTCACQAHTLILQGEGDHVPLSAQYLQGDSVLRCIRVSVGCQTTDLLMHTNHSKGQHGDILVRMF